MCRQQRAMRRCASTSAAALIAAVAVLVGVGQMARYRELNPSFPVQYNWDGKVWFGGAQTYRAPKTRAELQALVRAAHDSHGRVHVVGSGHSWNAMARADHLVSLSEHINRLIAVDAAARTITVEAGMRLSAVQQYLAAHGLSFSNLPSVDEQTVGGVVATATHGSGLRFENLSARVTRLELIDGTGAVRVFDASTPDGLFDAVRVSLGALGVITEVTFQAEPAFLLRETQHSVSFEAWANATTADGGRTGLEAFAEDNEHFKMWMEIHTGSAQVFRANRVRAGAGADAADATPRGAVTRWLDDPQKVLMEGVQWVLSSGPLSGGFRWFLPTVVQRLMPAVDRVDHPHNVFVIPHYLSAHQETEWSVATHHCVPALRALKEWVAAHQFPVNHLIEVRHVKRDALWLSPNFARDSCHITLLQCNGDARVRQYFERFERDVMARYDGRPHWAKTFYGGGEVLATRYPKWADFAALRRRMDPRGIFRNPWLEHLFDYA